MYTKWIVTAGRSMLGKLRLKFPLDWNNTKSLDEKWELTGISGHVQNCQEGFKWVDVEVLKVKERKFDRKIREALELQESSPHNEHDLNQDYGQYVTTRFWKPMFSYLSLIHI